MAKITGVVPQPKSQLGVVLDTTVAPLSGPVLSRTLMLMDA